MISHDVMHLLDYYYDNDFGQVMCVGPQPTGNIILDITERAKRTIYTDN